MTFDSLLPTEKISIKNCITMVLYYGTFCCPKKVKPKFIDFLTMKTELPYEKAFENSLIL